MLRNDKIYKNKYKICNKVNVNKPRFNKTTITYLL